MPERPLSDDELRYQDHLEDLGEQRKEARMWATDEEADHAADVAEQRRQDANDRLVDVDAARLYGRRDR
jgi:hypothetical protein